jgi:hypothetical protein
MSDGFQIARYGYLLRKFQKVGLIREKQQCGSIFEGKALISGFLTTGDLIPTMKLNAQSTGNELKLTYRMVPIKLSTKNLYSSAGASSLAFQTLL